MVVGIRTHGRVTFFVNSNKETNERKCRPYHYALRVPIASIINKATVKLAKNAQTVTAENPLLIMDTLACDKAIKVKRVLTLSPPFDLTE